MIGRYNYYQKIRANSNNEENWKKNGINYLRCRLKLLSTTICYISFPTWMLQKIQFLTYRRAEVGIIHYWIGEIGQFIWCESSQNPIYPGISQKYII